MSDAKSNWAEDGLVKLIFNATTWTGIARDGATGTALSSFYLSLHSSAPGEAGSATTNEVAYGAYARVAVPRNSTSGWTPGTGTAVGTVTLQANKDFPQATSGTATATHFAVSTAATGAANVLYYGTVTPNINITTGVTPRLTTGTSIQEK